MQDKDDILVRVGRPTYSTQGNTITFCRTSDLRNNEIVTCLPVIL